MTFRDNDEISLNFGYDFGHVRFPGKVLMEMNPEKFESFDSFDFFTVYHKSSKTQSNSYRFHHIISCYMRVTIYIMVFREKDLIMEFLFDIMPL